MKHTFVYMMWAICLGCSGGHGHEALEEHEPAEEMHGHAHDEVVLDGEQQARMGIATSTVSPSPFSGVVKTGGTIVSSPTDAIALVAPAAGQVTLASDIVEGATVAAGSTLFVIDTETLAATSAATQTRLNLDAAQRRLERARRLAADGLISQRELDDTQAQYDIALAEYQAATRSGAGAARVIAAASGTVTDCLVRTGDYVEAGQALATITRGNEMMLQAELPERHFERLGDIVSARFKPSYSTQVLDIDTLGGRLVACERVASGGGYLRVTFAFKAPAPSAANDLHIPSIRLIPGCYADVWLTMRECHEAICIPIEALVREGDLYFVFVQEDEDCFEKREVTLADNDGTMVEVVSGIENGERVVVAGAAQLALAASARIIPAHNHNH